MVLYRGEWSDVGFIILLALFWIPLVESSPGDCLDEFVDCYNQCEQISCFNNRYYTSKEERQRGYNGFYSYHSYNSEWEFNHETLPLYLRLLRWDCSQNCDYKCQRLITKERKLNGEEVYQFHGKWPFLRVIGIQELLSAIFSLGNLAVHVVGLLKLIKVIRSDLPYNLKYQFTNTLIISIVTISAWFFSTVFHVRDFLVTERLDYFFAGLTVLTGFHGILSRALRLYLPTRCFSRWVFSSSCVVAYALHVYRLVNDWSYTYNMRANLTVGALQNIFLCVLCFDLYLKYYETEREGTGSSKSHLEHIDSSRIILQSFYANSPKLYSLYPLLLSAIVIMGMLLEIFDFPPFFYDLIDAHSLWHLVTIIPAYYGWYDWTIWDIKENVWDDIKQANAKKND